MVHIKVAVRIRPMSTKERSQNEASIVINSDNCILVNNPKVPERSDGGDSRQKTRRFAVDFCYDPKYPHLSTQQAVFEEIGSEVLGHMFDGYNACVLAYGHSASGKTYTMMGTREEPGITPRICRELCRRMRAWPDTQYYVSVSFLEIYNEKVRDLLVDEDPNLSPAFSLRVREHPKLGPYVQDLSEHVIEKEEELLALLNLGNSRRRTAATESNTHSSRSHAVFTIRFKQVSKQATKSSKVHLVDLAGSERASLIQNRTRLKEGANINKSLVTLGNVISALADCGGAAFGKAWQPFVPYRDSVLTWLLKDTLGGNSNTIMIATISPASSCFSDTINTLRYAKRTKRIINQPTVNEDPKVRTIRELREEVSRLKAMLFSYTSQQMESSLQEITQECGASSPSKCQDRGAPKCAVPLQMDNTHSPLSRWTAAGPVMATHLPNDLLQHLGASPDSLDRSYKSQDESFKNICTLDILPTTSVNKQTSCDLVHASEINAENKPGVNRVIVDPTRQIPRSCSAQIVPRVPTTIFKRRRALLRRGSLYWTMLHRSRPDLIKGINTRSAESTTSAQTDVLSQSTSENSLHSSGSTELRTRNKKSLSRTSSIGDASGSSTPTQSQRPSIVRKKEVKRAEIVASVTSRLYATKKKPDPRLEALQAEKEEDDDDELEELKLCKRARMKLFDLSRKLAMAKKVKRTVDSECQTEFAKSTLRVKEKSVATDQQGVIETQTCATNTFDSDSGEPEMPIVMNQIFLGGKGKIVFDSGTNFHVEVAETNDFGSQTLPQSVDQSTSPHRIFYEISPPDEFFSDDSLESDDGVSKKTHRRKKKNILSKSDSFQCIEPTPLSNSPKSKSYPNIELKNDCAKNVPYILTQISEMGHGKRVEKTVKPVSRFSISGTNAFYEYNPNKLETEKVIFCDKTEPSPNSAPLVPEIIYHQFPSDSVDSLSKSSSDNQNSSSATVSASSMSSLGSSDSSSDDFIFIENTPKSPTVQRDLYTIAENSEPCSNQSSPVNTSLNLDTNKTDAKIENNTDKTPKKIKWAELQCSGKKQFLNFNYRANFNEEEKESSEMFPSQDSVTFVFLGKDEQQTSVLMNLIKRSLLSSPESSRPSRRDESQTSSKLMRSVSVDTAMIALSRIARYQRSLSDISRTASFSNVSTEVQVDLNPNISVETSTQCNISKKPDLNTSESCQCDLERLTTYSLGTNTTNDRETITDAELRESTTQTEIECLFDETTPVLPKGSISPSFKDEKGYPAKFSEGYWKDMKDLILGTGRDLFPHYLESVEQKKLNGQQPRKTVSWSDVCNDEEHNADAGSSNTRKVRFCEPEKANTLPRRNQPTAEIVTEFLREATDLLQELNNTETSHSNNNLLNKRGKVLSKIKITNDIVLSETSVQTEIEKVNTSIQTGSFASSLIGPPVRRSLTPNLKRENLDHGDALNSTWPRRRVAAKPPTGLKLNSPRSNSSLRSSSSRNTFSPRNNSIDSDIIYDTNQATYARNRSISRSPEIKENSAIELAYRNLKIEIERDRARERNFENCMAIYVNSDKPVYSKYLSNSFTHPNYEYNDSRLNERYSMSPRIDKAFNLHGSSLNSNNDAKYGYNYSSKTIFNYTRPSNNGTDSSFNNIRSCKYVTSETQESHEETSNYACRCFCHDLTCRGVTETDPDNCHTCCVPCSTDPPQVSSEGSLSPTFSSHEYPSTRRRRGSPLAHLNHLIALRRSIVAAQKANNFLSK